MATSELERLLIKLEVDTLQMRNALRDAESGISRFEQTADRSFGRAAKNVSNFGTTLTNSLRGAAGAIAAYVSAQAIMNSANAAANLEKQAGAAGMTVESFQALAAVAGKAGYDLERFADASATFAMKVTEARGKSGDFYEFLKNHLPTVAAQLTSTKDMASAYSIVSDAVARLGDSQSQALLTSKAFGESNRDLALVLREGSTAFNGAADRAANLGYVINSELAKEVKESKTAWYELGNIISGWFNKAVAEGVAGSKNLAKALVELAKEASTANEQISRLGGFSPGRNLGEIPKEQGALSLKPKAEPWMSGWQTTLDFTGVDKMRDLERQRALAVKDSATAIRLEYERELEEFRRLKAEGKIDEEEFQRARVMLNEIAGAQINESMKADREEMKQNLSEITYAIEDAISAPLRDAFAGNLQPMQTYFKQLLGNLAQAITHMLVIKPLMDSLTSSIGGSSFFSGLFGVGKRASGGPVTGGMPYLVGERGPELMVPSSTGRVIPNNALGYAGGGGGATVYNIDARGSDISVAERVQMALMAAERSRPKPVADVAAYRKRFPTRGA